MQVRFDQIGIDAGGKKPTSATSRGKKIAMLRYNHNVKMSVHELLKIYNNIITSISISSPRFGR